MSEERYRQHPASVRLSLHGTESGAARGHVPGRWGALPARNATARKGWSASAATHPGVAHLRALVAKEIGLARGCDGYTACTPPVHRRVAAIFLALAAVAVLAACGAGPSETGINLRNPTVPLGGTTRFAPEPFAGRWHTLACLGNCATSVRYAVAADGTFVRETVTGAVPYQVEGPGVLRRKGAEDRLIVMWVDEGFRTAAVGDVGGGWAAVIDRTPSGAADRTRAAIEILDFYGWDVSRLQRTD